MNSKSVTQNSLSVGGCPQYTVQSTVYIIFVFIVFVMIPFYKKIFAKNMGNIALILVTYFKCTVQQYIIVNKVLHFTLLINSYIEL